MHSQNTSQPDIAQRVLDSTLSAVRSRKSGRLIKHSTITAVLIACLFATFLLTRSAPDQPRVANRATEVEIQNTQTSLITHVSDQPLQLIERVPANTSSSIIVRVSGNTIGQGRIQSVTDEQLLASLPPDQPAGLVQHPDGSASLIRIE